jgi:ribose 5-phosphate isomerase B
LRVHIGADHAGFQLKQELLPFVRELGYACTDLGTADESSCDYPDIAAAGARAVASGEADRAVLVCGTGVGMCIAAGKVPGAYVANCTDTYTARMMRLHNNANVLALGGRVVGPELAKDIVEMWLGTEYSGDPRHQRRIGKVKQIEGGCTDRSE